MLKQSHRIGSLAAGKQADLVMIRATDLNMQPVHDAVNSVVMQTSLANIDSVMVAGQWKKRHGQLAGVNLTPHLEALQASGRKIIQAMAL
jgi:cytosine/adenosine deaminase-related metal-dependent hydrolase